MTLERGEVHSTPDAPTSGVRGLVLGKFLPLHNGHLHLVKTAAALTDRLTVLVCTLPDDPIPGAIRAEWMREMAASIGPHVRVVHVEEQVPQAPDEHPCFWEIWKDLCWRHAGRVDVVFTSEFYGDELARQLGARHHMVDLLRKAFPVSGTAVREDTFRSWEQIPPPVRAYYAARIALVGPESSGKTTLAARLAAAYGTVWVPEYGREHTERLTARPGSTDWVAGFAASDIETIVRVQAEREDEAARQANRLLFCDTELLTTRVWSEILLGECPAHVRSACESRTYDLYLLMAPDIPWVDDGTRVMPDRRTWHFERLQALLDEQKRPYVVVEGTFEERLTSATAAIDARWFGLRSTGGVPAGDEREGSAKAAIPGGVLRGAEQARASGPAVQHGLPLEADRERTPHA